MRTYAQLRPTFWTRGSGKKLRGKRDAQVLAVYLMSAPHSSMTGLYYEPMVSVLHDLGMTEEAFRVALEEISEIARYDFDEELVWLPNGCREQMNLKEGTRIKLGDKRLPGVRTEVEAFGNHPFALEFKRRYLPGFEDGSVGLVEGDSKGHANKGHSKPHAEEQHGACSCSVLDPVPDPKDRSDQPDRSEHKETGKTSREIPCPAGLCLTEGQRATLETALIPGWAIDAITLHRVASWTGNPEQRKHPNHWRQLLAHVIRETWNDPNKRPKKPAPSEREVHDANRRKREAESKRAAEVQQKLAASVTPEETESLKSSIEGAWK